jgi:predicted transcriptional regulator
MTPRQEEARRLALSGLTVKQIAAEMKCSRQGVEKYLKATGTQPHRVVKYTDEQIVTLHQEGLTDPDIARELGICVNTVLKVRHRLGIKTHYRTPILSSVDVKRLLSLAKQGWRQVDLAEEFGVHQSCISKLLIKYGLRRQTKRTTKQ